MFASDFAGKDPHVTRKINTHPCTDSDSLHCCPQILGKGFYFAPDPRLADFFNGDLRANKDKKLLLSRVACGAVATRCVHVLVYFSQ